MYLSFNLEIITSLAKQVKYQSVEKWQKQAVFENVTYLYLENSEWLKIKTYKTSNGSQTEIIKESEMMAWKNI